MRSGRYWATASRGCPRPGRRISVTPQSWLWQILDKMMADHEQQIRRVTDAVLRFGFKDVGSWLVVGGVEVAAAATGMPLYGTGGVGWKPTSGCP